MVRTPILRAVPVSIIALVAALLLSQRASADNALDTVSTDLHIHADETRASLLAQDAPPAEDVAPATKVFKPYGEPGQWWLGVGAGLAFGQTSGESAVDGRLTLSTSTFIVDNFEFLMDWSLWGYSQPGPDTFGISWSFLFRLHFALQEENRTTFFLDGGVGAMLSADEVPDGGTDLNFLPTLGVGLSHQLGDGPGRIVGGARWHHISNARIDGEERNPSRDGAMFYLAYTFPI